MTKPIEVIIVDDQPLFSDGLSSLLKTHDIHVVDTALNGQELFSILKIKKPDVILLDLEMPILNGSQTFNVLKKELPHLKIIIVSSYHDDELIKDYFNRGANAYVSKNSSTEVIVNSIRGVVKEGYYKANISELLKTKATKDKHYYKLIYSPRELQIIQLLCEGKSVKEIEAVLSITTKTVETHLTEIYKKAKVKNRQKFLIFAIKEGLNYLGCPK